MRSLLDSSIEASRTRTAIVWREKTRGITMTWFLALTPIFAGLLTPIAAAPSTSSTGLLLVANKGDQTLGLIDPDTGRQVATVDEGGTTGHEVVGSPDGKPGIRTHLRQLWSRHARHGRKH